MEYINLCIITVKSYTKKFNKDDILIYGIIGIIIIYFMMHMASFFFKIPVIIMLIVLLYLWYKKPTRKVKVV